MLNTLLITDIRINLMEDRKFRTVACRNVQTCLPHQGQQSDRLKRYRLTSGVWSGDDQLTELVAETDIDRNNLLRIEQRMSSFPDVDASLFIEEWGNTVVGFGKLGFGEDEVEFCKYSVILADSVRIFRDTVGKFCENCIDFFLLL